MMRLFQIPALRLRILIGRVLLAFRSLRIRHRIFAYGLHSSNYKQDGVRIHAYHSKGDGPLLVCLHGLLDSGHSFRYLLPELSQKYRLLIPDLPGFARSNLPPVRELWQLPVLARMLLRFLLNQIDQPCIFLTHSMGGLILLHMLEAVQNTGRQLPASAMHMLAPGLLQLSVSEREYRRRLFYPETSRDVENLFRHLYHQELPAIPETAGLALLQEWNKSGFQYLALNTIENESAVFLNMKRIKAIAGKIPVHLYWGEQDRITELKHGRRLAKELRCSLDIIPECGHALHLEKPREFLQLFRARTAGVIQLKNQATISSRKR